MRLPKWLDLPPLWLSVCIVLAWLSRALWAPDLPLGLIYAGWFVFMAGFLLTVWAAITLSLSKTTVVPHQEAEHLVTGGPFRFSRNPIYLSDLIMLIGISIGFAAPVGLALVPALAWAFQRRFILPEEERLQNRFGEAFEIYARKTRRWA